MNVFYKILIVDRCPVFGSGIKMILEEERDMLVHRLISNPRQVIPAIKSILPDLILIISFHSTDGCLSLIRRLKMNFPCVPVLVMVEQHSNLLIGEYFGLNVEGIIRSTLDRPALIGAIRMLLKGERFYSEEYWAEKYKAGKNVKQRNSGSSVQFPRLTKREVEIIRKLAEGLTHKAIADQLFISHRTVDTYRDKILEKLHLRNTAEIIRYVILHPVL